MRKNTKSLKVKDNSNRENVVSFRQNKEEIMFNI